MVTSAILTPGHPPVSVRPSTRCTPIWDAAQMGYRMHCTGLAGAGLGGVTDSSGFWWVFGSLALVAGTFGGYYLYRRARG